MIPSSEALSRITLNRDEERAVAKISAVLDGMVRDKFDGSPLTMQFADQLSPKVAYALQREYERGGWKVMVSAGAKLTVQLTPNLAQPVYAATAPVVETKVLPPLAAALVPEVKTLFRGELTLDKTYPWTRILVRMPTRGRPAQALSVLQKYRDMAGQKILMEVVLDEDDETMLTAEVQQRLLALGCTITVGAHKNKIEACNSGRVTEWDILVSASDDMWPVVDQWAMRVENAMREHFPYLDGAIYGDDGYHGDKLCTLAIIGKRWWQQCGEIVYEPEYKSLFCDTEQTALWTAKGRLAYVDAKWFEHRHHAFGKADNDALYQRNDALWADDEATFNARKVKCRPHAQWGFDQPPLWLSVCICTIPGREARLAQILDHLWAQILSLNYTVEGGDPRMVEILVDGTSGIKIGEKRQRLLDRANGHFVCSIDDDDSVAHDYFSRIVSALIANPTTDCCTIRGVMTTAGSVPETFEHSIKYGWDRGGGTYQRAINHLNPVRREIALQVGFKSNLHYNEDQDYGERLQPLLKTEVDLGDRPVYQYYFDPKRS